jgi:hemolysin III-related protein
MALYQRLSPARSEGERGNPPKRPDVKQPKTKYQLLVASEVPSRYAHNSFLRTGYRPINGSVRLCIDSLRFIHNETANIYFHLIPAAIALASNGFLHLYFRDRYPTASLADQLAIHVYLTTSVLCFGISSTYHTLLCHSEAYSDLWGRLDYVAIIIQTIGSFVSGIYVTFYCEPGLQKLYWTMVDSVPSLSSQAPMNILINGDGVPIVDWSIGAPVNHYRREPSVPEQSMEDVSALHVRCDGPLGIVPHHPCRLHFSICPIEPAGGLGLLPDRGPGTHYRGGLLCGE